MADEINVETPPASPSWTAELRNSEATAIAKMPETYGLLLSLAEEYDAGTLPEPARQRIEELRAEFADQASDSIKGWADGAVPDMRAFVNDLVDAAQQYQQQRPDLDIRAGELESDMMPRSWRQPMRS